MDNRPLELKAYFNSELTYNTKIKIAGNHVEFRRYQTSIKKMLKGTEIKKNEIEIIETKKTESENSEKFYSNLRATRNRLFDLISSNVRNNKDYNADPQRIKFMTLTFDRDIKIDNIKIAMMELTLFFKRLSYHLYKIKKNVIKYAYTWELQSNGRIHFHVVIFNMPYISNKSRMVYPQNYYFGEQGAPQQKRELQDLWGNGFVFINALKRKSGKNMDLDKIAGYIVKYMTKTTKIENGKIRLQEDETKNVYIYENYKKLGLENIKKYSASKGLLKPSIYTAMMQSEDFKNIIKDLKNKKAFKKNKEGNYLKSKSIEMKMKGNDIIFNRIWVATSTLKLDFLETMDIIATWINVKYSGIRKTKFADHLMRKQQDSFDEKQYRDFRSILI